MNDIFFAMLDLAPPPPRFIVKSDDGTVVGQISEGYDLDDSGDDHGPGCEGPFNCTCDRCEVCGEAFAQGDERAEMYDPDADGPSVLCHAQCGLNHGMEVA